MNINMSIGPLIALVAGILILIVPRLLNYIVAIYLIIIGLLGLFGPLRFGVHRPVILGYALFDDVPNTMTMLGAGIVMASTIYITLREARLGNSKPPPQRVE
jgi:hypothetical protein